MTPEEKLLIDKIVTRADGCFEELDTQSLAMDIVAVHNHDCKLRLDKLLAFDDFSFGHDISGIIYHLDRKELKLCGGFLPRCARGE